MRFVVAVLTCMSVGGTSLALADPPSTSPQQTAPAAPPAPAAPAATQVAPAAPAKPELDPLEKRFLAQGYRMQMRHGERVFCRKEEVLGSRLEGRVSCNTAAQLKAIEQQSQEAVERAQRGTVPKQGS
jgi:hypothetical protein